MLSFIRGWRRLRPVERVATAPPGKYPGPLVELARILQGNQKCYRELADDPIKLEAQGPYILRASQEGLLYFEIGLAHFERTGKLPEGFGS